MNSIDKWKKILETVEYAVSNGNIHCDIRYNLNSNICRIYVSLPADTHEIFDIRWFIDADTRRIGPYLFVNSSMTSFPLHASAIENEMEEIGVQLYIQDKLSRTNRE